MNVRPLHDFIIVKRDELKLSPLLVAELMKDKPEQGIVIGVGPGTMEKNGERKPLSIKVGDRVLFSQLSGAAVKVNSEEVFFIKEHEIIGIIGE